MGGGEKGDVVVVGGDGYGWCCERVEVRGGMVGVYGGLGWGEVGWGVGVWGGLMGLGFGEGGFYGGEKWEGVV